MNSQVYNEFLSKNYDDFYTSKKNYPQEAATLLEIFTTFNLSTNSSIIDIGCGTGEHAIAIAKKGYSIKGIDISEHMIKMANQKLSPLNNLLFSCQSIQNEKEKFNFAYSLFNVINCLESESILKTFLSSTANALLPGGIYIFDCWRTETILLSPPREIHDSITTPSSLIKRTVVPTFLSENMQYLLHYTYDFGNKKEEITHRIKLFTADGIKTIIEESCFKILKITGPLENKMAPLKKDDRTMTYIVQKI